MPEWIMKRYARLWQKFKDKEFTRDQAEKLFVGDNAIAVFLSDLRKAGWMEIKMHPDDARKTIYRLKNPQEAIIQEIQDINKDEK